jgi:tetratricopeptide (TPR) repeat protein
MALLYAKEGRFAEALRGATRLETVADSLLSEGDSVGARTARGLALAYRAHVAVERDSVSVAIDNLRRGLALISAQVQPFTRDLHRYYLARLIQDRGEEVEALRIYGSLYWTPWLEALGYLRRAELHERRGEPADALEYYSRFLQLWGDADEHLQPQVDLARQAMGRLAGERTSDE